jgi:hypothetical protein
MAQPLRRVMRLLVTMGIFSEGPDGRFGATPISDCFRDLPGTMRGQVLMLAMESYSTFGELLYTLQTGEPAFNRVFGMTRWEHLAKNPGQAATFNAAMQARTEQMRAAVVSAYDFSGVRSIVDVGGGRGTLIAGILKANPHLSGIVFDLEAGLAETDGYLKGEGVRDRCEAVKGSFFEAVPPGQDLYMLKDIVHDWSDDKAIEILATCRAAMGAEARLIIVEQVMLPRAEDSFRARRLFMDDVQMMVMLGGRERTEDEYRVLFKAARLRLTSVRPTQSVFSVIEAVPA